MPHPVTYTGKLQELASIYGISIAELLEEYAFEDTVPGICMREGCDFTTYYEPDQSEGWCEECSMRSVRSALVLGGII